MPSAASFFERYANAHSTFEAAKLLPFFDRPCLIIDDRGDHVIQRDEDLLDYEKPFLAYLERDGVCDVHAEVLTEQVWDAGSCACSVRYRLDDRDCRRLGDIACRYVLIRYQLRWRIKFVRLENVYTWRR